MHPPGNVHSSMSLLTVFKDMLENIIYIFTYIYINIYVYIFIYVYIYIYVYVYTIYINPKVRFITSHIIPHCFCISILLDPCGFLYAANLCAQL